MFLTCYSGAEHLKSRHATFSYTYSYRKRFNTAPQPEDMYLSSVYGAKRALSSRFDPRNLYRAVYGYRK